MKRTLGFLLLCLTAGLLAQVMPAHRRIAAPTPVAGAAAKSWLISELCEGTGTPTLWTNSNVVDWDYSTSGLDLEGSECLHIAVSATAGQSYYAFGSRTEVWIYFRLYIAGRPTSSAQLFHITDVPGGATLCYLQCRSTGILRLYNGTTYASPTTAIGTGADTYHIWLHLRTTADPSGDYTEIGFSTDGVRPTSGGTWDDDTTGDNATAMVIARWAGNNQGQDVYFDVLRADDEVIGDNGE